MGLIRWWKERKERKQLEKEGVTPEALSDSKTECNCVDCACERVERRGGIVRSAGSSRVIGGSGYVPSPSRRIIGGSRTYRQPDPCIIDRDDDGIDLVTAAVVAGVIGEALSHNDEPAPTIVVPTEESYDPPSHDYESPAVESNHADECGSTGCFTESPSYDSPSFGDD